MREPDADIAVAVAGASRLGESPMWHPREQVLYWCDIPGRRLNRFDPKTGGLSHWDFDCEPACVAPCLDGEWPVRVGRVAQSQRQVDRAM
jgi:sugar lactone lactonase YvrE